MSCFLAYGRAMAPRLHRLWMRDALPPAEKRRRDLWFWRGRHWQPAETDRP